MIDIADQGMRMAIQAAVGHPGPFTAEELAAISELRVQHASDVSEVRYCAGLTHLELVACAIDSLADVAPLHQLSRLHVLGCPIEDASPLAAHPALEDLRIDFCFLQDLSPLTEISELWRGRFVGNPLTHASWADIRPRWQRSPVPRTNRLRQLEFGPDSAWQATRTMWDHDVRLCFGVLDGVRPVLVRPGLAPIDGAVVDACQATDAGLIIATERGDSADEIFQLNKEYFERSGLARPDDFSSHRVLGDAQDARRWIEPAPERDRQLLQQFISNFPDQIFFREDAVVFEAMAERAGTPVPAPVASSRAMLAGILPDEDSRFRLAEYTGNSPRADHLSAIWYHQKPGVYSTRDRKKLLLDDAALFPLAEWIETSDSILAARAGDDDPAIYEFGEEDLYDARSEGRAVAESVYRVFASYPELLAHIDAFELPDGTLITARASGDP